MSETLSYARSCGVLAGTGLAIAGIIMGIEAGADIAKAQPTTVIQAYSGPVSSDICVSPKQIGTKPVCVAEAGIDISDMSTTLHRNLDRPLEQSGFKHAGISSIELLGGLGLLVLSTRRRKNGMIPPTVPAALTA